MPMFKHLAPKMLPQPGEDLGNFPSGVPRGYEGSKGGSKMIKTIFFAFVAAKITPNHNILGFCLHYH